MEATAGAQAGAYSRPQIAELVTSDLDFFFFFNFPSYPLRIVPFASAFGENGAKRK